MTQTKPQIHIAIENEQPVTTSMNVAENFNKDHYRVLRAIDDLKGNLEGVSQKWRDLFWEDTYTHPQNKQQYRIIWMTRDGFNLVAMGFTGKEAIKYKLAYIEKFNQMEQQLRIQLPGTYKEALLQLVEQVETNEQLELENKELKPKADYFDKYIKNKGVMTISVIAENYGLSAQAMNKLLHELGVQYKQGKVWMLYAQHKNKGFAHMSTFDYSDSKGNPQITPTLKWHPKGHYFIYQLLKENGVLPMIESEEI